MFLGSLVIWLGHWTELMRSSKRCFGELIPPTPESMCDLKMTIVKKREIVPKSVLAQQHLLKRRTIPRNILCMKSRTVFDTGSQSGRILKAAHQTPWSRRMTSWCWDDAVLDLNAYFNIWKSSLLAVPSSAMRSDLKLELASKISAHFHYTQK